MRKVYLLVLSFIFFTSIHAQISLTATAGTTGPTAYPDLSSAFTAINAGTHQGAITIDISTSFTDAGIAVLNSSGAGGASYTSIIIRPTGDAVTMSYGTTTGRGVIELNGADNITIDGDNPNSAGTNRNLTITNTAANTITYTSVIRVATSTAVLSNDNIIIRNCNLIGSATNRNGSTNTSTTGSENTTFGVVVGGNGGSTVTTAPTAITSVTGTTATGATVNAFQVLNNNVISCARGIAFIGTSATTTSTGITINDNTIGDQSPLTGTPPFTNPTNTVYTKGIYVSGTTSLTISGNSIKNIISYVATQTSGIELNSAIGAGPVVIQNNTVSGVVCNTTSAAFGIILASTSGTFSITGNTVSNIQMAGNGSSNIAGIQIAYSGTSGIIEKNSVSSVYNRTTNGWGCFGIHLNGGNAVTVQNNFIWDINAFLNNGGLSTQFGPFGIRVASGINHKILHNSIHLSGAFIGTNGFTSSAAFVITATSLTGLDVRNNIFSNTLTGAPASSSVTSIMLPASPTVSMNLTLNNNGYYQGSGTGAGIGQVGTTSGSGLYLATNFNAAITTPASNLRSITSTLSAAGTNDNASFGLASAAPFTSSTNLHIPPGTPTVLESAGAAAGVTTDIDGDSRNATTPDIGADEFTGIAIDLVPPSIVYSAAVPNCSVGDIAVNGVTITDISGVPTAGLLVPRIYYKKNAGSYISAAGVLASGTGTNGTWNFTITAASLGGLVSGDVISYYIIAQDISGNVSSSPAGVVATDVNTVTTHPVSPNVYVSGSLNGTYTVGTGGNFVTLTDAVNSYNAACLTGPVVFSLTDATYPAEIFPITINSNPTASGTNTLTIRPASGVNTSITGSSSIALVKFNGADYIIIDGSNNNSTSRNLTLTNTNSGTSPLSSVIWLGSGSASNGATNNIIRNLTTVGQGPLTTFVGIFSGSGTTPGGIAEAANSNNTFDNNSCYKSQYGIAVAGATGGQSANIITRNSIGSTVASDYIGFIGLFVSNLTGAEIKGNNIFNIITTATNPTGINVAAGVVNSNFDGNTISGIRYTGTSGYGGKGMNINTGTATSNLVISNNMISDIRGDGWNSFLSDAIVGIRIGATGGSTVTTGGIKLYNNSINLGSGSFAGSTSGTSSAALYLSSTTSNLDIRNNILTTNLVNSSAAGAKTFAIYSAAANTAFTTINNNAYSVTGSQGVLGFIGSDRTDLAAIQAGFGGNTASINFLPSFVSATDLHLQNTAGVNWCLDGAGVALPEVTLDIDANTRNNPPDIGADEFDATGFTITNPAAVCQPNTVDITAPSVTAGSLPGLTLSYYTDAAGTVVLTNPSAVSASGTYYIKASNGSCSVIRPVVVVVNPIAVINNTVTQPTTCVSSDGSITLNITGATGPFTFSWTGPGVNATAQNQSGLTIGVYTVTVTTSTSCSSTATFTLNGPGACSVCPVVGTLTTNPATTVCTNTTVGLTASGLADMGATYGITFKYSTTALADPYTGGTVITTVPNGGLTNGGTQAAANTTFAAGGNYFIYAILSPAPLDPACRPFKQSTLTVNTAPTITCPANVVVSNTTGQCGAVVNYPGATVTGSPAPTVTYSIASGSTFPIGITTVTATATNSCGTATCTFTVRVNDTQAPAIVCPANINTTTTTGQCGRVVNFTVTGTDNCPGVTVVSTPASGSTFPVGTTTVTNTATDAAGNVSSCSFTVTVTDSQVPVITTQPVNRSVCGGSNGTFTVVATNAVSYQWQVNTGSGFTNIPGATSATLTLNNVTQAMTGYLYRVIVNGLCTSVTSNSATLTVTRPPSIVGITASPFSKLSPGQVTSLSVTYDGFPGTFSWYRNNVLVRTTITPTITNLTIDSIGTYRVTLTDVNGCTATSDDFVLGADPNFQFFVYPNPNNGIFQVRFYSYELGVKRTLKVYDAKGSMVFKREFTMNSPYEKMEVDVTKYSAGLYTIELRDAGGNLLGTGRAAFMH